MSERYKMPVSVQLILYNKNKNILLLKRKSTGFSDEKYGLIGGHVEKDEEIMNAVIREAKEEVGIDIARSDLKFKCVMNRRINHELEYIDFIFETTKWSGNVQNMETQKCSEILWSDIDNLPNDIIDFEKYILTKNKEKYISWEWI